VEATRVAVDNVLQVSRRALETKRGGNNPNRQHYLPMNLRQQQGCISRNIGNMAATMIGVVEVAAETGACDDEKYTISDGICGGAAMVAKRVEVDIMDDNTDLLARTKERVAGEEAGSEGSTPAKTVETHTFEITKEFHGVEPSGTLAPVGAGGFHEVEMPVSTSELATLCECVSLYTHRRGRAMYLLLAGKNQEWSVRRPIDTQGAGLIIWSIEHGIRPWVENLRFDEERQRVQTAENRQCTHEWPRALLQHFWLQRQNHSWRCGRGSMLGVHMQQEAFSGSFWLFWIWQPGLLCKQQRTLGRKSPDESVAFDMSSTLVDKMEGAKAECEAHLRDYQGVPWGGTIWHPGTRWGRGISRGGNASIDQRTRYAV
jgi:hypothetical protein